jgi:hypothetical protein
MEINISRSQGDLSQFNVCKSKCCSSYLLPLLLPSKGFDDYEKVAKK